MKKDNIWKGIQWRVDTPEGTAYITVNEDPDAKNKIAFIQISIGKAGTSLSGIGYALAVSVSANLQFLSTREVQSMLSGIASDKPRRSLAKNSMRSIPEAIVWVLEQFLNEKSGKEDNTNVRRILRR